MDQILIMGLVIFLSGSLMLLEQRCIGKPAFIQPMVLCGLSGLCIGQEAIGIWLGISLQLLSIGQGHYSNWALTSVVAASSLIVLHLFGTAIVPGSPESLVLLFLAILYSILLYGLGRRFARRFERPLLETPQWQGAKSFELFLSLVHRSVGVGFATGGLQSLMGTVLIVLIVSVLQNRIPVTEEALVLGAIVIPLFGIAVTMGAMSRKRYPLYALIGSAVTYLVVLVQ